MDGEQREVDGLEVWNKVSTLKISSRTQVLGVKCVNTYAGTDYGIMADATDDAGKEIMVTDNSWNCSNTANEGWEKANFQEGNDWHPASCLGKDHYYHRNSQSWPNSPNRRVIWTNSGGDMTVYCRKIIYCKFHKRFSVSFLVGSLILIHI